VTGELYEDAPNLPQTLNSLMIASLAAEMDRVILHGGTGSPNDEPNGIFNTANVGIYTYGGAIADYSWVSQAVQTVEEQNLEPTAMVTHPKVYGKLDRLTDTTGQPLQPPRSYVNLAKFSTTNVRDDVASPPEACAFVGKWDEVVLGMRMGLRIRVAQDGVIGSDNLTTEYKKAIVAVARMDVAVLRPAAMCVVKGLGY
jgi:HK97 family phage major capsid protein